MERATVENILLTRMKDDMLAWVLSHPECMKTLLALALSNDPKIGWRAAGLLFDSMEPKEEGVQPFVDRILGANPGKRYGHQRELLKLLRKLVLDDDQAGRLFAYAVEFWEDKSLDPAVRYYAFACMLDTAERFPAWFLE
jgi:hypothetical protein